MHNRTVTENTHTRESGSAYTIYLYPTHVATKLGYQQLVRSVGIHLFINLFI